MIKFILLAFTLVFTAARAANPIVVGSLVVDSTFVCVSVASNFTGDDNGNATCLVEYKTSAGSTWIEAYTPFIDRRSTVNGSSNPYVNQARISIVGLTAGTAYDIRATWTDSDGVSGTNPATGSVTTLVVTPTLGAGTWYIDTSGSNGSGTSVSPFNNMASALTAASTNGGTINCAGAFPTQTTIAASGTSGAWLKIQQWSGHTTASFSGVDNAIVLTGSYLWLHGVTVNGATGTSAGNKNNVTISGSSTFVRIDNNSFPTVCVNGDPSGSSSINYGSSAIFGLSGCHHIYIFDNTIAASTTGVSDYATAFEFGIGFDGAPSINGTFVISGNTLTGTLRDGISSEGNSAGNGFRYNCDIYSNTVTGAKDDQIEADGDSINLRIWGNNLDTTTGNDCLSLAGINYGPCYVFRNYLHGQSLAIKLGNGSPGPGFIFHNTISVTAGGSAGADGMAEAGGPTFSTLMTYRNNLILADRYCFYQQGSDSGRVNSYDYDLINSNVNHFVADAWNPSTTNASYTTLAALNTAQGVEGNGVGTATTINANGTLLAGSAAINAGLALKNFNGPDSSWPYVNARPAIGFAEFVGTGGSQVVGKVLFSGKVKLN